MWAETVIDLGFVNLVGEELLVLLGAAEEPTTLSLLEIDFHEGCFAVFGSGVRGCECTVLWQTSSVLERLNLKVSNTIAVFHTLLLYQVWKLKCLYFGLIEHFVFLLLRASSDYHPWFGDQVMHLWHTNLPRLINEWRIIVPFLLKVVGLNNNWMIRCSLHLLAVCISGKFHCTHRCICKRLIIL